MITRKNIKKCILTLIILSNSIGLFSQIPESIIGTLSDSIKSWDLLLNGQTLYTIQSGELFYYYANYETALTTNRKSGKIPFNYVTKIDSLKYLRFEFTERDIGFEDFHEDLLLAKRMGINYEKLVQKAINHDGEALKEILDLESYVDGAATEMFADRFWRIIHFWSDEELSELLKNDTSEFKRSFSDFMSNEFYTGFTIKEIEEYLNLFFPKTLESIKIDKI